MKQFILSSSFILLFISAKAQITELRDSKPFNQLEVSGAANVQFTQGDSTTIKVVANDAEINNVYTSVENGILTVRGKGNFKNSYKIYVSSKNLNHITASGASKVTILNTLQTDTLFINATGASDVVGNINTTLTDVTASGASGVNLEGTTQTLVGVISGASSLKAYKLNSVNTFATVSGASTAKVSASQKINANATGASSVKFKGDAKEVSAEASSSSSVAKVVDDAISGKNSDKKDSTTFNFRKKKFVIINKYSNSDSTSNSENNDEFHNWAGFGIGVNGWLSGGSFSLPKNKEYMALDYGKSLNFQLNPLEKDIHIYKNYINLVIGLGFEWSQYEFKNRTTLNPDSSYTSGVIDSSKTFNYKKNRFKTTYVNIPVLVEFNSSKNPKKAFHLAVGVIGGYKLGSRTRQVLELDGQDIKLIRKDSYNVNPFRLNAHASVGYHNFTVYADYALTPLFENGGGPTLYPFTFGVKLVSF
jgi:hypothetical protein